MKRWRLALIGAAISVFALIFFLTQMDFAQFGDALRTARVELLIPVAALIVAGLMARAARWRVLLDRGLPYWRSFHILNVAYLANGVLPLRLGELARAYLAARTTTPSPELSRDGGAQSSEAAVQEGIPVLHSLSTVVVERLLDVLAVLVLLALALGFAPLPDALRASALLFLPVTIIGFAVLILLAARREQALAQVRRIAARLGLDKRFDAAAMVGHFFDGLAPLIQSRAMIMVLFWTAVSWTFSVASGYVLMFAFYPRGSIAATLLFTAAASFAVAVPAVPGNLGTYEASVWVGLAAMGYGEPLGTATAFAVTIHGLNLLINAVLGGIGLYAEGVSLGQLTRGVQAMKV